VLLALAGRAAPLLLAALLTAAHMGGARTENVTVTRVGVAQRALRPNFALPIVVAMAFVAMANAFATPVTLGMGVLWPHPAPPNALVAASASKGIVCVSRAILEIRVNGRHPWPSRRSHLILLMVPTPPPCCSWRKVTIAVLW
jgi:hypothetical protein